MQTAGARSDTAESRCPVCRRSMYCSDIFTIIFPTGQRNQMAKYVCDRCHVETTKRIKDHKTTGRNARLKISKSARPPHYVQSPTGAGFAPGKR